MQQQLSRSDYEAALSLLAAIEQRSGSASAFESAVAETLPSFVRCESVALSDLSRLGPACHTAVVPLAADNGRAVGIVLRRHGRDYSIRERNRLAVLQPHLSFMYRQLHEPRPVPAAGSPTQLTPRESEVMHWLACGKTDADIAALLAISRRTVHKHLEHIYEKLGVETRTAAVMALRRGAAAR